MTTKSTRSRSSLITTSTRVLTEPTVDVALTRVVPLLAALPRADVLPARADVDAAAMAARNTWRACMRPPLRGRLESLASIGEFELDSLDRLIIVAVALPELRRQADKALDQRNGARVPADLLAQASETEKRMQAACEHTLRTDNDARRELARLAPGVSYRDLARDLLGYADLYEQFPKRVALDGINHRAGDPKLARELAAQIDEALSRSLTKTERAALDQVSRGWTVLLRAYEPIARAVGYLERDGDAEATVPSLYAVARPGAGRKKKSKAAGPTPQTDNRTSAGAPAR